MFNILPQHLDSFCGFDKWKLQRPVLGFLSFFCFMLISTELCFASTTDPIKSALNSASYFEANSGRWAEDILYGAKTANGMAYLGKNWLRLCPDSSVTLSQCIELGFPHSSTRRILAEATDGAFSSYYVGNNPALWKTNIPHYQSVTYSHTQGLPDLVFYFRAGKLEFDWIVQPGDDINRCRLTLPADAMVSLDTLDNLNISRNNFAFQLTRPYSYQRIHGRKKPVPSSYEISGDSISIHIAAYDEEQTLIIDPVIKMSSFVGGASQDSATDVFVDQQGYIYLAGYTFSQSVAGSSPIGGGGLIDLFISKLTPDGSTVLYTQQIGGSGRDIARSLTVDAQGNVYLSGETDSFDFPLVNAFQQNNKGDSNQIDSSATDTFLLKLSADGSEILISSYFGGTDYDASHGIAVDSFQRIYITGETNSSDFPVAADALDSTCGTDGFCNTQGAEKGFDAFLAIFDLSRIQPLVYSTYLGHAGQDKAHAISLSANGDLVYIAGESNSTDLGQRKAIQSGNQGGFDAFLMVVDPAESGRNGLKFSSFLGGSGEDSAVDIVLDNEENILITGHSDSVDFPVYKPFQKRLRGKHDAFITKLSPVDNSQILFSTLFGGNNEDTGYAIVANSLGDIYVTGTTSSTNFPLWSEIESDLGGNQDGFISKFTADGQLLHYSSYYGGPADDSLVSIALVNDQQVWVAGDTESQRLPQTDSAPQRRNAGSVDTYLTLVEATESEATGDAGKVINDESKRKGGGVLAPIMIALLLIVVFTSLRRRIVYK